MMDFVHTGLRLIIAAGLLVVGVAACDTVKAPPTPRGDPMAGAYPTNVAIDGLSDKLVVDQPIVTPSTPSQPMSVSVPVRSVADEKLKLQYRFIFLDDRGRPLNQPGWQYITVEPRLQVFMQATALNTAASDYRLEIRPSR